MRRICTLDSDFEENAKKLTGYYLKRGYPFKRLKAHYLRAKQFTQGDLLVPTIKESTETPVMVTQCNPHNPNLGKFLRDNWNIIENTEELKEVFPEKPMIGYR